MAVEHKTKETVKSRTDFNKKETDEVLISFDEDLEVTGNEIDTASKKELKQMPVIMSIENLNKEYSKGKSVLKGINFNIKQGELLSIIGPSGAGKSTLLRSINRMIEPTSGKITFDDKDITGVKGKELRKMRTNIGMIFQHYNLVDRLSVFENVMHGTLGYKNSLQGIFSMYTESEKEEALDIITELGIQDHIYKRCDELSGGQKQRVGIARALVQKPKIILCDEPIASLDPSSSRVIMEHLRKICSEKGITVIVNLHQVDVAKNYSDRIIGLNSGQIVYNGHPSEIDKEVIQSIYGTDFDDLITE
ncbi:Phosphate-import ATP-binding protein PhnC [Jeotgalicoccus aerolatus]|uniref:Phosphonate transport system ATP-binding protein n=2 Tax=Jeotgalicoccus aerolatus TaxID=709510 RepID=A0ABS4HR94_9STAP|nr:phosphonate transport system ATP-binding protein [Jeotgalicoccus aerolatus]GGE07295.1 phosphonates import ATP-binding protein PhnC [Jeotgalicoccus aerolatus]CAD2080375.1 Phosphate-import ATP-binding protein PhnC [Jeotgalicoccus aerolatus]